MCSAGSDGNAIIWTSSVDEGFVKQDTLNHSPSNGTKGDGQIYVCEPISSNIDRTNQLLTAADNEIYLWNLEYMIPQKWSFEVHSGLQPFGGIFTLTPSDKILYYI